jgi:Nucleotidyl transferase AbiEii toxin, Type IV TA system
VTYDSPQALRMALEHRLRMRSDEQAIGTDRLRRRVLVERIVARLEAAEPGRWVLKGGMALEARLREDARLTKDVDLGLRDEVTDPGDLHERLIDALEADPHGDGFVLTPAAPSVLGQDGSGHPTWRVKVAAALAGKPFGGIQLDISPRPHELDATDRVTLTNSLDFAGIPAPVIEIVDLHRHAAEKLHAMSREFGDRENSRVRDLVDLVILREHDLLSPAGVATATKRVWAERDGGAPPTRFPALPESWPGRYESCRAGARRRSSRRR